jgi:hypothetical protein
LPGAACRFARLDDQQRVKFIVPVGEDREPRDVRGTSIAIVHDLGIRMVKPRGMDFRPTVPDDALILQEMWQLVQAYHSSSLLVLALRDEGDSTAVGISCCAVCGDGDTDVRCAVCLLSWHSSCSAALDECKLPDAFLPEPRRLIWAAFADAGQSMPADGRHV